MMIVSANKGGLSNRIKSMVSCLRYGREHHISVGIQWPVLNSYTTAHHLLNCPFGDLFVNDIEVLEVNSNDIVYRSPCLKIFERDDLPQNFDSYDPKKARYMPSDKTFRRNIDFNYTKIPDHVKKRYMPYFKQCRPIPSLQKEIDSFSKKFDEKTISVHIRSWCGRNEESRYNILFKENGIQRFEKEMSRYPEYHFFLATDSQYVKDYFLKESILKNAIVTYPRKTLLATREIPSDNLKKFY